MRKLTKAERFASVYYDMIDEEIENMVIQNDINTSTRISKVKDLSVDTWNAYMEIPNLDKDDVDDFRRAIHTIQRILGMLQLKTEDKWI